MVIIAYIIIIYIYAHMYVADVYSYVPIRTTCMRVCSYIST